MAVPIPDQAELQAGEDDWANTPMPEPGQVRIVVQGAPTEPLVLSILANLVVGSTVEGSEQLAARLKQWQASAATRGNTIYSEPLDESAQERTRYALIGLLALLPEATESTLGAAYNITDSAYRTLTNFASPFTGSRLMRPVRTRYNRLATRGETIVDRWVDKGRMTEQQGRALARVAAVEGQDEAMNEVIGVLSTKPEVRDLLTQQSYGMADEVVTAVRERSAAADERWELRIRRWLRRS